MAAAAGFLIEFIRAALGAAPANGEEDVDAAVNEVIDRFPDIDRAARSAEDGAAETVDALDVTRRELQRKHPG